MKKSSLAVLRKIDAALADVRRQQQEGNEHPFLPVIVLSLENMKKKMSAKRPEREGLMGALGRILTDDYSFATSSLGSKIMDAANAFAEMPDET